MANTTFNGPVRSENGFEQISVASGTGTVTTNLDIDSSGNITTTGYVSAYDNVVSIEDATYRSIRITPVISILVLHNFLIQQRLGTPTPLFQMPVMMTPLILVQQNRAG